MSVNAYGVVEGITYPLIFQKFQPKNRLQSGDKYKTKPQIAVEIIQEFQQMGWKIKLVLTDSHEVESGDVIRVLEKLNLEFIVAIRFNHGVLMPPRSRKRYNRLYCRAAKAFKPSNRNSLSTEKSSRLNVVGDITKLVKVMFPTQKKMKAGML